MIRLIQRRLIIPRGDTGSFSIPLQSTMSQGDVAMFYIYDKMTKTTVQQIQAQPEKDSKERDILRVTFERAHTAHLQPKKYYWDIVIYHNPIYDEQDQTKIIDATQIDSYYAAFSLPICDIREVAQDV